MKPIAIAMLVVSLLLLIILVQNLAGAGVGVLFWDFKAPLSLMLVVFYILGGATGRPLLRFLKKTWHR